MMKMVRACFLSALLIAGGCDLFRGTDAQLARAEATLDRGDYGAAAILLRTLVQKHPDNGRAQLLLARVLMLQGEAAVALEALDAAVKAGADPAESYELRAQIELDQGKFKELLVQLEDSQTALTESSRQRFKARALLGLRQPVEALAILDGLIAADPKAADLLIHAAECHAMLGRVALASEHVDRALALNPDSARAWLLRSALMQGSDFDAAQTALQKAVKLAPGQLGVNEQVAMLTAAAGTALNLQDSSGADLAHAGLLRLVPQAPLTALIGAQVKLLHGQNADAVSDLQRLAQRVPQLRPARAALVGALLATGSFELALQEISAGLSDADPGTQLAALRAAIKEAAEAKPESQERALKAAAAAASIGQLTAARQIVQGGLQAHPDSLPLAIADQQMTLRAGQVHQGLEKAQKLAKRLPEDRNVVAVLAEAQTATGDHGAAAASYESLWSAQRTGPLALALAQARLRSEDKDPLAPLAQWLADHPQDVVLRLTLASMAQQQGQSDRAVSEFERVVAQQPRNAVALNNLAWLYWQKHDGRALATARRAHDIAPAVPAIADTYGWLLAETGDVASAVPILREAVKVALSRPEVRYHLAVALYRSGDAGALSEARSLLKDALRDPQFVEDRTEAAKLLSALPPSIV